MSEISSTADQMLSVLEEVVRSGALSVADIGLHCGVNRTVAHRLVATLHRRGYLRRDGAKYVVGPAVARLASRPHGGLGVVAPPLVRALADEIGETVVLHVIDGLDAMVLDQMVPDRHVVRVQHRPGSRSALYLGASGRAILAFQPDAMIARLVADAGEPTLLARLQTVKTTGYDVSHDELQQGVHGMAAPIRDPAGRVSASMGILVPSNRAPSLPELVGHLIKTIKTLEAHLEDQEPHPASG